ncbi:MAG: hypothetical protein ABI551_08510, partial [Polyangiaceae bacterium]
MWWHDRDERMGVGEIVTRTGDFAKKAYFPDGSRPFDDYVAIERCGVCAPELDAEAASVRCARER